MEFYKVLNSVSKTKDRALQDDTIRSFTGASLVSGVITPSTDPGAQTTRITRAGDQGFATGTNQSNRGQINPSTLNKVPRIYGQVTTGGVIVDAIKLDANTIQVAMVISEMDKDRYDYYNQSSSVYDPSFIVSEVLRDNAVCGFNALSGQEEQVVTLTDLLDSSVTSTSAGNTKVWVWAGSSAAADQVFPNNSPNNVLYNVNAYDVFGSWTSAVTMEGLLFAIVQVGFQEDIIDELGQWRFTVASQGYEDESLPSSTIKQLANPGWALLDYLTSDRYGLGLANADIDIDSITDWTNYCGASVYYASDALGPGGSAASFPGGGSGYVNPTSRFRLDGFLNTQDTVLDNINRICDAGMATFNYNHKEGKFSVLYNKEMESTDQANAFHFTTENVVSSITLNTSDIFSLYDFAEVTFPNYLQLDSPDTIIVSVPAGDRFTNEITATTSFSLETVSDRPRAARIGNISLKQSRVGTVVQLTADHSSMTVDVGDFVKVTDELKGWTEKYFRVMRIREAERDGVITCTFTLQEYTNTPYEEIIYYDTVDEAFATGFGTKLNWDDPTVGTLTFDNKYTSFTPVIQRPTIYDGLYVYDDPIGGTGKIINPDTGAIINPSVPVGSAPISIQNSPDLVNESWLLIRTGLNISGGEPEFQNVSITVNATSGFTTDLFQEFAAQSVGTYTGFPITKLPASGTFDFTVKYVRAVIDPDAVPSLQGYMVPPEYSVTYQSATFSISDQTVQGNSMIDTYGTNSQIVDTLASTTASTPSGAEQLFGTLIHDVIGHASGTWQFDMDFTINYDYGGFTGTEYLNIAPEIVILFVNTQTLDTEQVAIAATGVNYSYGELVQDVRGDTTNSTVSFSMDPDFYGLDNTWYASRLNVRQKVRGNSLTNVNVYDQNYTITNKGVYYRGEP